MPTTINSQLTCDRMSNDSTWRSQWCKTAMIDSYIAGLILICVCFFMFFFVLCFIYNILYITINLSCKIAATVISWILDNFGTFTNAGSKPWRDTKSRWATMSKTFHRGTNWQTFGLIPWKLARFSFLKQNHLTWIWEDRFRIIAYKIYDLIIDISIIFINFPYLSNHWDPVIV